MNQGFQKLGAALMGSPALWLSVTCCCWAYGRSMLHQLGLIGRASLVELTLVTLIGTAAALIGLRRDHEQAWYLNLVTMVLNGAAWWLGLMQVNWAAMFRS